MSRRRLLVGLGSATTLSGCSLGTPGSESVTVECVDVLGSRSESMFDPAIERLESRHGRPIDFRYTELPYGDMKRKLLTRIGGNDPPDVAAIDQIWLGEFIDSGRLVPLEDLADAVDIDDYIDEFLEPVTAGRHVYGFPITTDVRGMYWNRDLFADAGLDPDTPPETWDQLREVAPQLHDPPATYGVAYLVTSGRWTVNLFQSGGRIFTDDGTLAFQEDAGVRAARFVDALFNEWEVTTPNPRYATAAALSRAFLRGQYAIVLVEGSWLEYYWRNLAETQEPITDRFGFAPTPRPADGTVSTMSGGFCWTASESTDHPEIVRDFIEIVAGEQFQRHLAIESQSIPTRRSLLDDDDVWANVQYADQVRDLLQHTRTRPARHWQVVASELDTALQRVAYDRDDPETALETAADAVRSEL